MKKIVLIALFVLAGGTCLLAHDGGFGHSRRTIWVSSNADSLILEYRITQNADEALLEVIQMDRDGNGQISAEERERHFAGMAKYLGQRLQFQTPAGSALPATFVRYELQNSLTQIYRFSVPTREPIIILEDGMYPHKPGAVRVVTAAGLKAELAQATNLTHVDWLSVKITRSAQP